MSKGIYPLSAIRYPLLTAATIFIVACSPKGEALYARADGFMKAGDARAAMIDLKNLVKEEPQNAKARALLADALARLGDTNAAAVEIQKAKDLGAPAEMLLVPECRVLVAQSEFQKAVDLCKPDAAPADARFEMQLASGRALLGLERAAEAVPVFEAAVAAQPDSLDALVGLASATYQIDGLAAAKDVLGKATANVQKQSAYWMTMGGIDTQAGDFASAEKSYLKAVDTAVGSDSGERLMALGALAEAQMRLGKIKEANTTSERLIKAAPNNPMVKQLRGQIAAAGGKYDEARTLLEEAVAAMPDNAQARLLLGIVNVQQGNLGQAEMHFASVVAKHPDNVQAQRLLAEVRAKVGTPQQSLQGLRAALDEGDADPMLLATASRLSMASGDRQQALDYLAQAAQSSQDQRPDAQLEIAGGYLMAGDLDGAIKLLEDMPTGGSTGFQRDSLLLAALLRKGDTERAVKEANALIERSPDDPVARNLAAAVFNAAGKQDAARSQLVEALKLKPNDLATLINLARMDLAANKPADAEKNFRKVLEGDPANLLATLGVAVTAGARGDNKEAEKWLLKAKTDHPDTAQTFLALAQFYGASRDLPKARAAIDEGLQRLPDNAQLLHARGLAQLGQNDIPGAIASLQQALEKAPGSDGYALNLARAHLANRDLKSALDVLNGVLKRNPKFAPALALAASASLGAGETEKAAGYVERLKQLAPDVPPTHSLEGDLAMAQKRYGDALALYRKANASGATSDRVLAEYRAATLAKAPQPEKVLADWVAKHPDDDRVVTALAEVKHSSGDIDGAIRLYEQALQKRPDSVPVLNNLAVIYQARGNPKALELAAKAFELAPKAAPIQDTYGWLLFEAGKHEQALDLLAQANQGMPNNPEVQYHYAAALAKAGRTDEAVALLRKAVAGTLPDKARADAEKLLKSLAR